MKHDPKVKEFWQHYNRYTDERLVYKITSFKRSLWTGQTEPHGIKVNSPDLQESGLTIRTNPEAWTKLYSFQDDLEEIINE